MLLVGVCGKKRHGKTTFTRDVVDYLTASKLCVKEFSFAEKLKEIITDLLNVGDDYEKLKTIETPYYFNRDLFMHKLLSYAKDYEIKMSIIIPVVNELWSYDGRPLSEVYRKALQLIGTEIFRASNENIWIEILDRKIKSSQVDIAIISDVRFPNEAEYVSDNGGMLVKLVRLNIDDQNDTHASERYVDEIKCDFVFKHDSLQQLMHYAYLFATMLERIYFSKQYISTLNKLR